MTHALSAIDRRGLLIGAGASMALAGVAEAATTTRRFPRGFHWGVATAGHQIEGNNTNSDLWFLENIQPTIYAERSGDACDSYHRYEEDIALLARLGFNTYRFSIEWARIEPSPGQFSIAELDHYQRVIDCCHRRNVAPAVTFLHGTAPRWFAMAGGWLNPEAPRLFANFCSRAARALASGMNFAFTINEPQVAKTFRVIPDAQAYFVQQDQRALAMLAAAARALNVERFVTTDHPDIATMTPILVAGHEQAFAAIKAERSDLPVGVTLSVTDFEPSSEGGSVDHVRRAAYGDWVDSVRRAGDFTGVQVYQMLRMPTAGTPLPALPPMPMQEGEGQRAFMQRPEALGAAVEYIYRATNKPVLVTENGLETNNDARRIWYIDNALASLHDAIARGVPVLGYLHWSLLDNFEWSRGYAPKFGLVAVDRTTFVRTPKPSAAHLGNIARRNAI